jgi:hypothetical protein
MSAQRSGPQSNIVSYHACNSSYCWASPDPATPFCYQI